MAPVLRFSLYSFPGSSDSTSTAPSLTTDVATILPPRALPHAGTRVSTLKASSFPLSVPMNVSIPARAWLTTGESSAALSMFCAHRTPSVAAFVADSVLFPAYPERLTVVVDLRPVVGRLVRWTPTRVRRGQVPSGGERRADAEQQVHGEDPEQESNDAAWPESHGAGPVARSRRAHPCRGGQTPKDVPARISHAAALPASLWPPGAPSSHRGRAQTSTILRSPGRELRRSTVLQARASSTAPRLIGPNIGGQSAWAETSREFGQPRLLTRVSPSLLLFEPSGQVVLDQVTLVTVAPERLASDKSALG